MNPFNGKLVEATAAHLRGRWMGAPPGERFRCGLCGHKFELGDRWRGVMANIKDSPTHKGNFLVCAACHDEAGGKDMPLLKRRAEFENKADELSELGIWGSGR